MSTKTGVSILRAWRHSGESGRIHYIIDNGIRARHLYVDEGNILYSIIEESELLVTEEGRRLPVDVRDKIDS